MNDFPWVIVGIIVGLVLVVILVVLAFKRRKEGKPQNVDYRTFFILGITFLPLGVLCEIAFFISDTHVFLVLGLAFIAMGISYVSIGLANRDKWKSKT